jgi:PAS domain S-box-containing protein
MNARLLGDTDGRMVMEGLLRDITTRKQAENELRMMKLVLEQTADLVTITDRRGSIEYVNSAFEEVTGYWRDEVVGRPSNCLKSGHQGREFYRAMWDTLERGEVFHGLLVNRRKNGELFDEEKTITPVRDAEGKIIHYVSTGKNVTAKRQLEAQVQQSEKLASIGQLAAGVAHEINNPVGYINSNIGSLRQYIDNVFELLAAYEEGEAAIDDAATRERIRDLRQRLDIDYLKEDIGALIDESQEGVKRVKTIVQDLKDFSRTDSAEYDWIDLHHGLNSTLNIVHNEIKYKAEVVKAFGELPLVECVGSQINQVFMNLLVNATHAIEGYGTITIRSGTEGESQVWVEVEDTGKGISEENLTHIFDPFFTTKPVGQGTGLGLSLSYGIIQKHGGRITVKSEVGKGSCFRIVLPISQTTPHSDDAATVGSLLTDADGRAGMSQGQRR